jgi:hypothetical protein
MRSTIIPAQITTVEDKIVGDISFTQIILLLIPVLISLALHSLVHPAMHLSLPKTLIILILFTIFFILSFRLKGRLVLDWLIIYSRYSLRPSFYVLNKNDSLYRTTEDLLPETPAKAPAHQLQPKLQPHPAITTRSRIRLDRLLSRSRCHIECKPLHQGRLHVAYQQIDG